MEITREYHFYAAHRLHTAEDGHKCKSFHGHTYYLKFWINTGAPDKSGVTTFFSTIDEKIDPIIKELDHSIILCSEDKYWKVFADDPNQKVYLLQRPTSVENILIEVFQELKKTGFNFTKISLRETTSGEIEFDPIHDDPNWDYDEFIDKIPTNG